VSEGAVDPVEYSAASADPLRRFALIGLVVIAVLVLAWWVFIRTTWQPILTNIDPGDAADAVKVLEAKKIAYRLEDEGRTVLVASDNADKARVELVGSELPMRGQVGFELFNQSDMGLTEFAQKINYQRALQGELARTILTLDGIASVRVHLGLPDRSVFRDERSSPRASVTLLLKPGHALTVATVRGVQQLVSGAIPDMTPEAVAVLDGEGRVVSVGPVGSAAVGDSDALIQNWQRLISEAIRTAHPDLRFEVGVSLRYRPALPAPPAADPSHPQPIAAVPVRAPRGDPDYALAVRITTEAAPDDALRNDLARITTSAAGISSARGDSIVLTAGPVAVPSAQPLSQPDKVVYRAANPAAPASEWPGRYLWSAGLGAAAVLLLAAWWNDRRRARRRRQFELDGFAKTLRERLQPAEVRL